MKYINYKFIFFTIFSFLFLYLFNSILIYFYISMFLSFLLNPMIKYISNKFNISRKTAIFLVISFILILFILLFTLCVPIILEQFKVFINNMPIYINKSKIFYENISSKFNKYEFLIKNLEQNTSNIINHIYNLLITFTTKIVSISSKLIYIAIVFILTIYFLFDYKKIKNNILIYLDDKKQKILTNIINKINFFMWEYIKYKTIISFIISLITFFVLKILNAEYVLILSIITFFLDYIPYFGSIFSGIIIFTVVMLSTNINNAILAIVTIFIVQQIEGNFITPQIQGKSLGIHPIILIFTLLACDKFWGAIGMFIAIPIAIIIKICLSEIFFMDKIENYND